MKTKQLLFAILFTATAASLFTAYAFHALGENKENTATFNSSSQPAKQETLSALIARIDSLEQQLNEQRNTSSSFNNRPSRTPSNEQSTAVVDVKEATQPELTLDSSVDQAQIDTQVAAYRDEQRARGLEQMQPEFKIQELVDAGFNKDEASWIVSTETEVQLSQLRAQYEARRESLSTDNNVATYNSDGLRNKLGDDYYERYLEAKGMPTSISVGGVMTNSPGANAGLMPGDEIVAYDNKRVFSIYGLNRITATGREGESVLIEVERDGQAVQLTIPRGPIGVQSNQFGRRR